MVDDCVRHSGQNNESSRRELDDVMQVLPENQSGEGRHKCPYCAYELGLKTGKKSAIEEIIERLRAELQ